MDIEWVVEFLRGIIKPVAALSVVAMALLLSSIQKLGLEGEMIYSVFRAFLQLSIIGLVLQFIFSQENSFWILVAYLFMVSVAVYTAGKRAKHVPKGKYIAGVCILGGTSVTMFLLVILNVFPFTPRYIIPVSGMMVGNAMTVTGVTMKRLRDDIKVQISFSLLACFLHPCFSIRYQSFHLTDFPNFPLLCNHAFSYKFLILLRIISVTVSMICLILRQKHHCQLWLYP